MDGLSFQRIFSHVVHFCIRVGIFYVEIGWHHLSHTVQPPCSRRFSKSLLLRIVCRQLLNLSLEGDSATSWAACSNGQSPARYSFSSYSCRTSYTSVSDHYLLSFCLAPPRRVTPTSWHSPCRLLRMSISSVPEKYLYNLVLKMLKGTWHWSF